MQASACSFTLSHPHLGRAGFPNPPRSNLEISAPVGTHKRQRGRPRNHPLPAGDGDGLRQTLVRPYPILKPFCWNVPVRTPCQGVRFKPPTFRSPSPSRSRKVCYRNASLRIFTPSFSESLSFSSSLLANWCRRVELRHRRYATPLNPSTRSRIASCAASSPAAAAHIS